ncbi:DUF3951 domain-containing protein [Halobacillus rhizosphaerae]|uniref:DUF3951 domain-containing protein n=1 Tax=Halobacillus rhizosphaerae TaxID=3064889 RepID=UPI00398B1C1D
MIVNVFGLMILLFTVPVLIGIIIFKKFIRKRPINSSFAYTPFDYITGQSKKEFHDRAEELQSEDENQH